MSLLIHIERPSGAFEEVRCDEVEFHHTHVLFWADGIPIVGYHADEIRTMTTEVDA